MNLDDFFELINSTLSSDKFKNCSYPVYRGHSKGSFELLPTLHRIFPKTSFADIWELENNLYCDFRALVGPRIYFKNSWDALFTMRHEGIPTRLLDWTENIGTALFFALDSTEIENPHIWVLDPYELNNKSKSRGKTLVNPEEDVSDYQTSYANKCNDDKIVIHELPIALYPNRNNDRIFAQRGLFTLHGTNESKLELTCSDVIEKISIPEELIGKLKDLLRQFGVNKYSVYPDLKGLCEYMKSIYDY